MLSVFTGLACGALAGAHSALVSASPGNGERVEGGPGVVRAVFNEPLQAGASRLEVVNAEGKTVGKAESGGGPEMAATVGDLPPGEYTVRWSIVSADGHALRGSWRFTVAGSPAAGGTPGGVPAGQPGNGAAAPRPDAPAADPSAAAPPPGTPAAGAPPAGGPDTTPARGGIPRSGGVSRIGRVAGWAAGALAVAGVAVFLIRRVALASRQR